MNYPRSASVCHIPGNQYPPIDFSTNIQGVAKQLHQTSQGHRRAENNGGCTSKKKSISASLPTYGHLKSKHIFINISKTTDLNFKKFCTLTFPAKLFPMMTPFLVLWLDLSPPFVHK